MKAENGFKEFFILDLVPPIHSLNIIVKTKNIEHNEINAKNFVIPIITRYISKIIVNTNEGSILNNVAFGVVCLHERIGPIPIRIIIPSKIGPAVLSK